MENKFHQQKQVKEMDIITSNRKCTRRRYSVGDISEYAFHLHRFDTFGNTPQTQDKDISLFADTKPVKNKTDRKKINEIVEETDNLAVPYEYGESEMYDIDDTNTTRAKTKKDPSLLQSKISHSNVHSKNGNCEMPAKHIKEKLPENKKLSKWLKMKKQFQFMILKTKPSSEKSNSTELGYQQMNEREHFSGALDHKNTLMYKNNDTSKTQKIICDNKDYHITSKHIGSPNCADQSSDSYQLASNTIEIVHITSQSKTNSSPSTYDICSQGSDSFLNKETSSAVNKPKNKRNFLKQYFSRKDKSINKSSQKNIVPLTKHLSMPNIFETKYIPTVHKEVNERRGLSQNCVMANEVFDFNQEDTNEIKIEQEEDIPETETLDKTKPFVQAVPQLEIPSQSKNTAIILTAKETQVERNFQETISNMSKSSLENSALSRIPELAEDNSDGNSMVTSIKTSYRSVKQIPEQRVHRARRASLPNIYTVSLNNGNMFGKKQQGDVKKSASKVLDTKKDNVTRLKHLRVVLGAYDNHEAKSFFDQNYSHIYFIFYEAFVQVENDLKPKANKSHREELDYVLHLFEKLLTLLPELIHKRWQYHSIGRLMKKLLHSGNSIKLRREGMRLFLLWYQILMDNATEECHLTYASLVPRLGPALVTDVDIFARTGLEGQVAAVDIAPVLLPQPTDQKPENLTKWLLENLLNFSVSEVKKVEWSNKEMHEFSFNFLFNKFKEHYLVHIFPDFNKESSLYSPCLDLPEKRNQDEVGGPGRTYEITLCQEVLVKWLAIYAHGKKSENGPSSSTPRSSQQQSTDSQDPGSDGHMDGQVPGSNASTLSTVSTFTEKDSTGSSICSDEHPLSEQDIVRQVLYSTRENVNMVQEVFRQAFLFPFTQASAMRKVISVYKEWFHEDLREIRPSFFQEPIIIPEEDSIDGSPPPPSARCPIKESTEVRAGLQNVLQVFITNSANVFLLEAYDNPEKLEAQVDMCKRVLNIYRYLVMNHAMEQTTWEQLLLTLLKVVSGVMSPNPPSPKENTLGGKLAQHIFQTLIVTWIKANLNVYVSADLWDHLLQVLSSLTGWVQLIREWAKTMETLTRVLARQVYGLDLNDLPLNRLSEHQGKKSKGAKQTTSTKTKRDRTFSRAWSRQEMVENLRSQLIHNQHLPSPLVRGKGTAGVPLHRHGIQSISGISDGKNAMTNNGMPRSHSTINRQRSRSGHTSPVRSGLMSDTAMDNFGGGLVRSNSDTSIMMDFKGSKEGLLEPESSSLQEGVLACLDLDIAFEDGGRGNDYIASRRDRLASQSSMYYSASEGEDDILMQSTPPSQRSSVHNSDLSPRGDALSRHSVESHHTYNSSVTNKNGLKESESSSSDIHQLQTVVASHSTRLFSDKYAISKSEKLDEALKFDVIIYDDMTSSVQRKKKLPQLLETNLDDLSMGGSQSTLASVKTDSETSSYKTSRAEDENRNKVFDIQVDEKGNVERINVVEEEGSVEYDNEDDRDEIFVHDDEYSSEQSPRKREMGSQTCLDDNKSDAGATMLRSDDLDNSMVNDSGSVGSVESSPSVPYQFIDSSTDTSSVNMDKQSGDNRSDTEVLLRLSDAGSDTKRSTRSTESPDTPPLSTQSSKNNKQRASSEPSPRVATEPTMRTIQERRESSESRYKDSLTPDRESLHIEEADNLPQKSSQSSSKSAERQTSQEEDIQSLDMRSILAGGNLMGWTPDVAVILWRRLLGVLGDVNQIKDPLIHEQVLEHLCDFVETMLKMRDNLAVSLDNQSSPTPPELLPPGGLVIPWLFEALNLPDEYKMGKLLAYQLLCTSIVCKHDMEIPQQTLSRFYKVLHQGLVHSELDTVNVLVRHCGPKFFSLSLPGSSMLILDFVQAINTVVSSTDLRDAPRVEATSILGALLCFPNHFGVVPVLQPESVELDLYLCQDVKEHIISILLKSGKKEPSGLARCIAISSIGMFLYEELLHNPLHPRIKDTFNVLLSTLRFNNKAVAQVATDALSLLCDHVDILLAKQPTLPRTIIETICTAIWILLRPTENSNSEEDKRLLTSIMFCLLEWCIRLPMSMLLDESGGHKSLLYKTFRVLNLAVTGTEGTLTPRGSMGVQDFSCFDDELENVREGPYIGGTASTPLTEPLTSFGIMGGSSRMGRDGGAASGSDGNDILKLTARVVMSHLVRHLGHFPMGSGAARMNTAVQEHHDMNHEDLEEFNADIFNLPNVQLFLVNNNALVSFVEIPAFTDLPGGGVTAGLTTGKNVTRVIIRDIGGKYCWDNVVLYGPPQCRAGSYPAEPQQLLCIPTDLDLVGCDKNGSEMEDKGPQLQSRQPEQLPVPDTTLFENDILDEMLQYIGETSPECQLYHGEALNVPFHPPVELPANAETGASEGLLLQSESEAVHVKHHVADKEQVSNALKPMDCEDTSLPFHLCRLYINQLGYLQWGKRPTIDLLRKSDKLIRHLKYLDSQHCRETHKFAVIYVAHGQEDKQSILANTGGSQAYEEFVSALGWEVELEHHPGYLGGLQTNKSTGVSAPYYATSTQEAIFHVSTRMPSGEDANKKLRHLGNDEVQIVWCEHSRDYRRGIIPTEYGDVLIIIYPLQCGLFRIHIDRKAEIPYFGPLFDGAIVNQRCLPGLVRATALNASHTRRTLIPYYQTFYKERAKYVEDVVSQHKEQTTFEDFSAHVFAPVLPQGGDLIGSQLGEPLLLSSLSSSTSASYQNSIKSTNSADLNHKSMLDHKQDKSPQGGSGGKSKEGSVSEGAVSAFSRRLSFGKGKKSVTKQMRSRESSSTPPESPNSGQKNKK